MSKHFQEAVAAGGDSHALRPGTEVRCWKRGIARAIPLPGIYLAPRLQVHHLS